MSIQGRAGKTRQRRYSSGSNTPLPPDQGDLAFIVPGFPLPPGAQFSRGSVATYYELEGGLESNDNRFVRDSAIDELRENHWETWPFETVDPFYRRTFWIEELRVQEAQFTEDLSDAFWTKIGCTITPDASEAPDESITMDKLVESAVNEAHEVVRDYILADGNACATIFFKPDERLNVELRIEETATPANFLRIKIDGSQAPEYFIQVLDTGGTATLLMGSIDERINGSVRILLGGTLISGNVTVRASLLDDAGDTPYLGNGASGGFMWGMQVENDDFPTSYMRRLDATAFSRLSDVFGFIPLNPQQVPFSMQCSWVERGTIFQLNDRYWQLGGTTSGADPRLLQIPGGVFGTITVNYDDGVTPLFLSSTPDVIDYRFFTDFMVRYRLDQYDIEFHINGGPSVTKSSGVSTSPGNWANPTTLFLGRSALLGQTGNAAFLGFIITSDPDFPLIPTQPPIIVDRQFEDGLSGLHFLSDDVKDAFANPGIAGFNQIGDLPGSAKQLAEAAGFTFVEGGIVTTSAFSNGFSNGFQ